MSGTQLPFLGQITAALQSIATLLGKAVTNQTNAVAPVQFPNYTVASLPTSAPVGSMAYATNGRKPGEGAAAGTGVPVWFNVNNQWFSVCSGVQVTS